MPEKDAHQLHVTSSEAGEVPVFGCVVNVSTNAKGWTRARVANLANLESSGASERDALSAVVAAFKAFVGERLSANQPLDWIDPPVDPGPDEQQRFIPVHL